MKRRNSLIKLLTAASAAMLICTAGGCGDKTPSASDEPSQVQSAASETSEESTPESSAVQEGSAGQQDAQEGSAEPVGPTISTAEGSEGSARTEESAGQYGTEEMQHPSYCVGKWSLKLDTSGMESDELSDAKERMSNTSMVLNTDGTASGLYAGGVVKGGWGVEGGYIYVVLGGATEVFRYYIDTLESMNYPGMYFVK